MGQGGGVAHEQVRTVGSAELGAPSANAEGRSDVTGWGQEDGGSGLEGEVDGLECFLISRLLTYIYSSQLGLILSKLKPSRIVKSRVLCDMIIACSKTAASFVMLH